MVGNVERLVVPVLSGTTASGGVASSGTPRTTLYIPLQFWFCRNPGLALPLIALQYHEVKINITFNDLDNCAVGFNKATNPTGGNPTEVGTNTIFSGVGVQNSGDNKANRVDLHNPVSFKNTDLCLRDSCLLVDYIYLDTDERRRFAQVSHEYLIEQLQYTGEESINSQNTKIKLNFNHPVKELVWVVQKNEHTH